MAICANNFEGKLQCHSTNIETHIHSITTNIVKINAKHITLQAN